MPTTSAPSRSLHLPLYVRIWLAVVLAVAVLTLLAGWIMRVTAEPPLREVIVRNAAGETVGQGQARLRPPDGLPVEAPPVQHPDMPHPPGHFGTGPEFMVRMQDDQRKNENVLFNQSLTFRNQTNGQMMQVPISAVSQTEKTNTYNQIKRKNYKRIMTIYSNVLTGYNGDEITKQIANELTNYKLPKGVSYSFSGVQEEQGKNQSFLMYALFLAMAGITLIIVLQFNSVSKTIVILFTVLLSFSGVFYGYVIANMDFVILMTMMGIISLAGIVVKNGIVLMDFFVLLLDKKVADRQLESHDDLTLEEIKEVIIESGKSRLRPVLLTALTAVLGLIPLAIGLNFDFFSLITDFNPHIFIGGDNVMFWGPLAWTIIFGLTYATVLTLVMVPVMFYLVKRTKYWLRDRKQSKLEQETM